MHGKRSFFNEHWQELESKTSEQTTYFVWGTRYIDDLILREKGQEKLYALHDPNWNVVALTNVSGTIQERMKYDAFGKVTWMDAAFATKANSGFAWNRTFTGQVFDSVEVGLMLYRNRYYYTGYGRFISRDPIGYEGKDKSLYRYVGNRATVSVDSYGLQSGGVYGSPYLGPYGGCAVSLLPDRQQCSFLGTCGQIVGTYACRTVGGLVPAGSVPEINQVTISNTIFNHPSVTKQMTEKLKIIKNRLCISDDGKSGGFSGKDCGCYMSVGSSGLINNSLGCLIIHRYSLDYDVKITKGPYGEKRCYDVDITWKFSDHIEPKDADDALYPEKVAHRFQQCITKADFYVCANKKESRTFCCCE